MQKKLSPGAYRFRNVCETCPHATSEQTQPHGHAMVEQPNPPKCWIFGRKKASTMTRKKKIKFK